MSDMWVVACAGWLSQVAASSADGQRGPLATYPKGGGREAVIRDGWKAENYVSWSRAYDEKAPRRGNAQEWSVGQASQAVHTGLRCSRESRTNSRREGSACVRTPCLGVSGQTRYEADRPRTRHKEYVLCFVVTPACLHFPTRGAL